MWRKPEEMFSSDFSYGSGYKISHWSSGRVTAKGAFNNWKESGAHNDVMIGAGGWRDLTHVGCFFEGNFANCWFAKSELDIQADTRNRTFKMEINFKFTVIFVRDDL